VAGGGAVRRIIGTSISLSIGKSISEDKKIPAEAGRPMNMELKS
jgi:hypothetical protein